MRRAWVYAAGVVLGAATAYADDVVERDNVNIAPAAAVQIKALDVDNRLGDVTVVGRDAPGITLSVEKHAPDGDTLERLKVNLTPDPSGVVMISSALLFGQETRPVPAGSVRIDIHLEVPRGVHLSVKAWNGKVAVSGTKGGATLAAHDADIAVTDVQGVVTTTNTRGAQRLTGVSGTVSADNTYGDLALDEIRGDSLAARSHMGRVVASRISSRSVRITTTFGDIKLSGVLVAGGRYELRSYHGNVEVQGAGSYQVDAYSRDGRVVPEVQLVGFEHGEDGHWRGAFGVGSGRPAVLEVSSAAGNIRLGLATVP